MFVRHPIAGMMWAHGITTFIGFVLLVIGIVLLVMLVRRGRGNAPSAGKQASVGTAAPTQSHAASDPLAILDARLARGEIEVSDYEARRQALLAAQSNPTPSTDSTVI